MKIWKAYHQSKRKWPYKVLFTFLIIALLHPFIANERPLLCKIEGQWMSPVFKSILVRNQLSKWKDTQDYNWDKKEYDFRIMPLIPYSFNTLDQKNAGFKSPFEKQNIDNLWQRHWLGTDVLGRDVFAGILKGTEIAIKIGFISAIIAGIIALILGVSVAYYKRFPVKMGVFDVLLLFLLIIFGTYLFWFHLQAPGAIPILGILFLVITWFSYLKLRGLLKLGFKQPEIRLNADGFFMRILEAMKSIPTLIFLLACTSLFDHINVWVIIMILGFIMWPGLSRYVRADSLKTLSQDYILAAKQYGASNWRIMRKHVIPKSFTSLSVVLAFAISSAIIVEATLSFLGLGIPLDQVSWGLMLKEARMNFSAWWMAIFPGLALFLVILSLNVLSEDLDEGN